MLDETMMYSSALFTRPGMDLARCPAGEARPAVHQARPRPRRPRRRDRDRMGRVRLPRRRQLRLPGHHHHHLGRPVPLRVEAGRRGGPGRPGDRAQQRLPGPRRHLRQARLHRDDRGGRLAPARHLLPHLRRAPARRGPDGAAGDHHGGPQLRAGQERHRLRARVHLPGGLPPVARGDHPLAAPGHADGGGGRRGHRAPLRRDPASLGRERHRTRRRGRPPSGSTTRFQRLWHFYLCYCEGAFLERHISDVQMVLAMPGWRAPLSVRDCRHRTGGRCGRRPPAGPATRRCGSGRPPSRPGSRPACRRPPPGSSRRRPPRRRRRRRSRSGWSRRWPPRHRTGRTGGW